MVFLKRGTSPHTVKWHDFSMAEMGEGEEEEEQQSGEIVKILRNSHLFFFPFSLSLFRIIRKQGSRYPCVPIVSRQGGQGGEDDRSSSFTSSVSSKGEDESSTVIFRGAKVDVLVEGSNIKTSRRVKLLRKGFQSWLPL